MINLTLLTQEIQDRCDALTNASTPAQVLDCSMTAYALEVAGGLLDRTILDNQLQRIADEANGSSTIEHLLMSAASSKSAMESISKTPGIGTSMWLDRYSEIEISLYDESEWLRSGYAKSYIGYNKAINCDHLKVYGNDLVYSSGSQIVNSITSGLGCTLMRFKDGTGQRSINDGDTWASHSSFGSVTDITFGNNGFTSIENSTTAITFRSNRTDGDSFGDSATFSTSGLIANTAKVVYAGDKFVGCAQGSSVFSYTENDGTGPLTNSVTTPSTAQTAFHLIGLPEGGVVYNNGNSSAINILSSSLSSVVNLSHSATVVSIAINIDTNSLVAVGSNGEVRYWPNRNTNTGVNTDAVPLAASLLGLTIRSVSYFDGFYWLGCVYTTGNTYASYMFKGDGQVWELVQLASVASGNAQFPAEIKNEFVYQKDSIVRLRKLTSSPERVGTVRELINNDMALYWRIK